MTSQHPDSINILKKYLKGMDSEQNLILGTVTQIQDNSSDWVNEPIFAYKQSHPELVLAVQIGC